METSYLKGLAEAIAPYLMPYVANKVRDELSLLPSQKSDEPELLTKKQVMAKYQISSMSLWRFEQAGKLIPVRMGSKVMYRPNDVEKIFV